MRTNPGFRAQRMKLECGPINDPELRQQCIASFGGGGGPPSARKRHSELISEEIEMTNLPGFAGRPDYRVDLVPESRRVEVVFGDVTIAESSAALRCEETSHGPVHYLPQKDVRLDLLRPTDHHTRCPYKGEASYWTIEVPAADGSVRRSETRWAYPTPMTKRLAGYYAFYDARRCGHLD